MDDIAAVAGLATLNDNKKDNLEHGKSRFVQIRSRCCSDYNLLSY